MAWDFETDPEYQEKLDWADRFVREEVEPLDYVFPDMTFVPMDDTRRKIIDPLKDEVRRQGLWATHLGPELGGQGYGQLKLALLNEILGRSPWASNVFGTQAPDTGNAEIIAHYGTPEQKERYLQPLLNGELFSCYSMTEPHAGADPTLFKTRAVKDGDEWVINGWKFFSSNAKTASFLIVMAVTSNTGCCAAKGVNSMVGPGLGPSWAVLVVLTSPSMTIEASAGTSRSTVRHWVTSPGRPAIASNSSSSHQSSCGCE
jgi:acyl-CoA dehydrogenase